MTMRRLDRKRLFEAEKLGKTVDVGASDVMKNAIVSATQHREGHKLITDIVLDLGSSKVDLKTQAAAAADPIGTSGTDVSYFCRVTDAVFGTVTSVETVCLEAITDGTLTDYDIMYGDATGYLGSDAGSGQLIKADIGTKGQQELMVETTDFTTNVLSGKYLYITAGDATTKKATAVIDCSSATIGNVVSGVTRIRLAADDGSTVVDFVADSGTAFGAAAQANKFNVGSVTTTAELAQGIAIGINNNASFSASPVDGSSDTITVTVANVTTTSNNDNFLVDDPQSASGIVVPAFSGGIPNDITSGKLLVRFTGFVAPDDI